MTKAEVRIEYKHKRRKLAANEKDKLEDLILIHFQRLPIFDKHCVMSYSPIQVQNEYDTILPEEYFIFRKENVAIAYPIINRETDTMVSYIVADGTEFELNEYGIAEPVGGVKLNPKDISVMFVPLIAFDKNGYRVGYGKGYYDKFIKLCNPNMIKIGFSFFEPVEIDDINEYDQKLNYCITPEKIYEF
jgi:5-formyltetrahydrofolate cyclo-ligase